MTRRRAKSFTGIAASPGIWVGLAHLVDRRRKRVPKYHLHPHEIEIEEERFGSAVQRSVEQLEALKQRLRQTGGREPTSIIEAHLLMLRDEMLLTETLRRIREDSINAEWALSQAVLQIRQVFDDIEDDYFRERRSDIDFVRDRIMRNLLGEEADLAPPHERAVVVAHDLSPADSAALGRSVGGLVTEVGAKTSHTAIIARALEVPAVVGVAGILSVVGSGDRVLIDGYRGQVTVHPTQQQVVEALARSQGLRDRVAALEQERTLPARTRDGHAVRLSANIEMVDDVKAALRYGADAIGLFRTEFLFMGPRAPGEGFQRRCYEHLLRNMPGRPVTIRTLDLGGDKNSRLFGPADEQNPAMGLRSIRLSLRHRALFLTQLRALLRSSPSGMLQILFPMIATREELREARAALDEAREQLKKRGQPFAEKIRIGIMIEVPSAAMLSAELAREVDFFSIGTNDLIQYLMAVDRHNKEVAYLYNPLHPAVLRMLAQVIEAAHRAKIDVCVCGEMAGNPEYLPVLLGLGVDEISVNPAALPFARHIVLHASIREARRLVGQIIKAAEADAIQASVRRFMAERFPDFFSEEGPADILGGL